MDTAAVDPGHKAIVVTIGTTRHRALLVPLHERGLLGRAQQSFDRAEFAALVQAALKHAPAHLAFGVLDAVIVLHEPIHVQNLIGF